MAGTPASSRGGGAITAQYELSQKQNQVVSPGVFATLTWLHDSGATLLSYTDPTHPTALAAGLYMVTANFSVASGVTTGAYLFAELDLDENGADPYAVGFAPLVVDPAAIVPAVSLHVAAPVPAGGVFSAYVKHANGIADLTVNLAVEIAFVAT